MYQVKLRFWKVVCDDIHLTDIHVGFLNPGQKAGIQIYRENATFRPNASQWLM